MRPVDEALPNVDCPVTKRLPEAEMLVVEALARFACVPNRVFTVPTVVDEVLKTDWPETVRAVVDAVVRVVWPVAFRVEVKMLVADTPVVEAFTMLASVEKSVVVVNPVDDAVESVA